METKKEKALNALTIDVEDYYQVSNFEGIVKKEDWDKYESRVYKNTRRLLDILDEYSTKATFFILGWTAEKFPELVAEIDSRGHEAASHGYWHKLVYDLTKEEFRDDLSRSLKILEGITGKKVLGFRAASCSITKDSLWALDILKECGMRYDASVFPIHHSRYGIPEADRYMTRWHNNGLVEFPFSTIEIFGHNLPIAGGGYFRLYPYWFTRWAINKLNREGHPAMVYIHPWEIDDKQPRMKGNAIANFRHYVNLTKNELKIRRLLTDFRFTTIKDLI